MAANALPAGMDGLMTLGEDIADGLAALGAALGMVHYTEAVVRGKLTALQTTQAEFLTAKAAKLGLTTAQTVADSNGRAFISTARNVLATFLGGEWTQAWEPTGFPNQSTAVPATLAERQALLGMLKLYFTANAAQEVAALNVTAARANTLFNALSDTRSADRVTPIGSTISFPAPRDASANPQCARNSSKTEMYDDSPESGMTKISTER